MHLLIINHEYPPIGGGAATASCNIAREAVRMGERVTVLTSSYAGLPAQEELDGVRIIRIRALRQHAYKSNPYEMLTFLFSSLWWACAVGRKLPFDVCVAFFGLPAGPAAWLLKRFTGLPYVISLRGGDVPGLLPKDLGRWHRLTGGLIRFLWKRAAAVVANSQGLAALARDALASLHFPVIPNGVDVELFCPRPPTNAPGQPVRLLFVGRLSPEKNLPCLFTALARMTRSNWSLDVVGDGPLRSELEALAKCLDIADKVRFLGWVRRGKIAAIYNDSELFVFPSIQEGMPNTVLEAMASGLPVIACNVEGCEDLIRDGENGRLVPANDIEALSSAISELLNDMARRQEMGQAGRQLVEQHYAWSNTAKAYIDLCHKILRSNKTSRAR